MILEYCDQLSNAIDEPRGQAFLRDLLAALDAMPVKRLIADQFYRDGGCCALGAFGRHRGIDPMELDPENPEETESKFKVAYVLAREMIYLNDAVLKDCTPEERWQGVRDWVAWRVKEDGP